MQPIQVTGTPKCVNFGCEEWQLAIEVWTKLKARDTSSQVPATRCVGARHLVVIWPSTRGSRCRRPNILVSPASDGSAATGALARHQVRSAFSWVDDIVAAIVVGHVD